MPSYGQLFQTAVAQAPTVLFLSRERKQRTAAVAERLRMGADPFPPDSQVEEL